MGLLSDRSGPRLTFQIRDCLEGNRKQSRSGCKSRINNDYFLLRSLDTSD